MEDYKKKKKDIEIIEEVFAEVDKYDDLVVDKRVLMRRLREHPLAKGLM